MVPVPKKSPIYQFQLLVTKFFNKQLGCSTSNIPVPLSIQGSLYWKIILESTSLIKIIHKIILTLHLIVLSHSPFQVFKVRIYVSSLKLCTFWGLSKEIACTYKKIKTWNCFSQYMVFYMFTIICKAKRNRLGLKYLNNVELNLNSICKMITKRTQKKNC
jgi:hypothetical protein